MLFGTAGVLALNKIQPKLSVPNVRLQLARLSSCHLERVYRSCFHSILN